jgi:hypothetical protein
MAGGLLNIISVGNNNVFLNGNPSKTFFKVAYSKYTNFGLQKFRIDYDGLRDLRLTDSSTFKFKIPRYAELLMDTYLVVNIPDIWSPVYNPTNQTNLEWVPYEFKWITNLGTQMIQQIDITCGSTILQSYTGEYLDAMVERDFNSDKKNLFNAMTGNVPELNDPANAYGRIDTYPNAFYSKSTAGAEPSIRGRQLFIPINTWFTLNSGCAFPLIALQYNELYITVTLRPIQQLFVVRDPFDNEYQYPYVQPDFTQNRFQMYRFLQTPPSVYLDPSYNPTYNSQNYSNTWNADVHLLSTYCFLSKEESKHFAAEDQIYLIKDVMRYNFENITGTSRLQLYSTGMVSTWMWFLQRHDVYLRNEWSNYTNWPYRELPSNITIGQQGSSSSEVIYVPKVLNGRVTSVAYGIDVHPNGEVTTGINVTGDYRPENQKEILSTMGILLNGEYRENTLTNGIFNYVEKYTRTPGFGKEGLYCYNFCLNTSQHDTQPSGALNLSNFKTVELEISTIVPPIDLANSSYDIICDACGNHIGFSKSNWKLYDYNFNLTLYEERYNILSFIGGNCGMLYAR